MKIALCYKEGLLRDALEKLLAVDGGFKVVESAAKVSTALSAAKVHDVKVIVVVTQGLDSDDVRRLQTSKEGTSFFLLGIAPDVEAAEALDVPFDKLLPLATTKLKLIKAIAELSSRETRKSYSVRERPPIYGMVRVLTPREHEIALKVAEGSSNRDIAEELNLAEQTVKNLVSVIMRKMECRNRTQVALKLSRGSESLVEQ